MDAVTNRNVMGLSEAGAWVADLFSLSTEVTINNMPKSCRPPFLRIDDLVFIAHSAAWDISQNFMAKYEHPRAVWVAKNTPQLIYQISKNGRREMDRTDCVQRDRSSRGCYSDVQPEWKGRRKLIGVSVGHRAIRTTFGGLSFRFPSLGVVAPLAGWTSKDVKDQRPSSSNRRQYPFFWLWDNVVVARGLQVRARPGSLRYMCTSVH